MTEFALLLVISWVVMTLTHEMGHIVGGWIGGATLTDYDVAPWRLPYSFHKPDPNPLLTLWAGPVIGVAAPGLVALLVRDRWLVFVADFCLLANGAYLALAWMAGDYLLDTPRLLKSGSPPLSIAIYCLLTIGVGYRRFRDDCVTVLSDPPLSGNPPNDSP